jgi:hypothetical protein
MSTLCGGDPVAHSTRWTVDQSVIEQAALTGLGDKKSKAKNVTAHGEATNAVPLQCQTQTAVPLWRPGDPIPLGYKTRRVILTNTAGRVRLLCPDLRSSSPDPLFTARLAGSLRG